jgi:predicted enzyme related to lactoylglutathione lyase
MQRTPRATGTFALALLSTLALAASAAARAPLAGLALPALSEPASGESHPGKVIWADLVTPDIAAAERFYAGLLGWSFKDLSAQGQRYAVALLDGQPVAGLLQRPISPRAHKRPAWLTFIAVRDVDTAIRNARSKGAQLVAAASSYPDRGRQAILSDPQGAVFAVLASSSGDPPDLLPAVGDWIWSSLLTRDPGRDAAFYQDLFTYEVFDQDDGPAAGQLVLSTDDYARVGVSALPAAASHGHPHWLNFVRVDDATAAADKAVALGGKVLVAPYAEEEGVRLAVIADPQGAPLGLMEWAPSAPAAVAP